MRDLIGWKRQRTTEGRLGSVVLALLLVVGLSACGGDDGEGSASTTDPTADGEGSDWDAVVEAAKEEGGLTVFLPGTPAVSDALAAAFESKYGIEATIIGGAATELQPRFDEERRSKKGEVDAFFSASAAYLNPIIEAGEFASIESPELDGENFSEFPRLLVDDTAVQVVANPPYIMWNTDLVDEPVKGYADLLERADEFDGRIAAPDLYADLIVAFYSDVETGTEKGWLEELLATDPNLFTGANPLAQSVASGESMVGIAAYSTVFEAVKATGAPVEGIVDDTALNTVNLVGAIPTWAAHPSAGQVFIDFVLSEEGQAIIAQGSVAVRDGVETAIGGPELIRFDNPDYRDPDYLAEFRDRWDAARG